MRTTRAICAALLVTAAAPGCRPDLEFHEADSGPSHADAGPDACRGFPCPDGKVCRAAEGVPECVCAPGLFPEGADCAPCTTVARCGLDCQACPGGSVRCAGNTIAAASACSASCGAGSWREGEVCWPCDSAEHCGSDCQACPVDPHGSSECAGAAEPAAAACALICADGFWNDAGTCADCGCSPNAFCDAASGAPECRCRAGYTGDGHACTDCLGRPEGDAYLGCSGCFDLGAVDPAVLFDQLDPIVLALDGCENRVLAQPALVERLFVQARAGDPGGFTAYLSLEGPYGLVGEVTFAAASTASSEATFSLPRPGFVAGYTACAWDGPGTVAALRLLGSPDANQGCLVDCSGEWGFDYLDRCGTCIDRTREGPRSAFVDTTPRILVSGCDDYPLPEPLQVESVYFEVQANGALPDPWVYLIDEYGAPLPGIELRPPADGAAATTRALFPPVFATGYHLCSWWNPSTLVRLELFTNRATCSP